MLELVDPQQHQQTEVDERRRRTLRRTVARIASPVLDQPIASGDRPGDAADDGRGHDHPHATVDASATAVDPVEVAVQHEERERRSRRSRRARRRARARGCRATRRAGTPSTMLTTFSTQLIRNGVRVSSRDVNARNEKRYERERQQADRERGERVGDLDGVARGERAPCEERDDDRTREAEVERDRGRDDDRGEPQTRARAARAARRTVASRGRPTRARARTSSRATPRAGRAGAGRTRTRSRTRTDHPACRWRGSVTTNSAIWLAITYPTVQPETRTRVTTAGCRNAGR